MKKKHLLKWSSVMSLPLVSLVAISCSDNQNIPPANYEMINVETKGLAFNSKGIITKFYKYGGSTDINLEIPEYLTNNRILTSEYYGYKQRITSIGNMIFSANKYSSNEFGNPYAQYLNSIKLPNSIETIGIESFYGTPITEIIIPDSVVKIGSGAFENCINLVSVKLSKNTKIIGAGAFSGTSITSIEIPDSVSFIEANAFYNTKLNGLLVIPDSVGSIYSGAFQGTQITEVSIPKDCGYDISAFPSGCNIIERK